MYAKIVTDLPKDGQSRRKRPGFRDASPHLTNSEISPSDGSVRPLLSAWHPQDYPGT